MKKRILIAYCTFGSGHKTLAETIAKYFEENSEEYEVFVLDVTKYSNFVGRVGLKLYDINIKYRTEFIFNFFYESLDNRLGSLSQNNFVKKAFINKKLEDAIKNINPDISISTHFYAGNIISYYNNKKIIHTKLVTVITDYASHSFWRKNHAIMDAYVLANEIVKKEMISKGIDAKKLYSFGLPFDENRVLRLKPKYEIYNKYKINPKRQTYLMFGGGSAGAMYYFEYFKVIAKQNWPMNIIFICGKNQKLEKKAKRFVDKHVLTNIKVLGFTTDVFNIMQIADYVISKPGGATVTECIMMKKPMILIPGYGGQEKYNARFVVSKGYGLKVRGKFFFKRLVKKTIDNTKMKDKYIENLNNNKSHKSLELLRKLCDNLLKDRNK